MSVIVKLGLIAFAVAAIGCNQVSDAGPKHSVTVKLKPPRFYKPEPGFSLATELPLRNEEPVKVQTAS